MKKYLLILLFFIPVIIYGDKFEKHADYSVCFTPYQNCTNQVVDSINNAVSSVQVQAYSFTSRPIGDALVTAKERGVDVNVIFDKSILKYDRNTAWYFVRHGIPVWIDSQLAIAHNKVMIIDQTRVITGSFNFTRAAEQNNAENLLIIDDGRLAQYYLQNWQKRQAVSQPLVLSPITQSPMQENWFARFWHWLMGWLEQHLKF
jgi:phosphatidylserine/phosphatidylglycerophosphate/cardiolipin synthase-like enzyme